MNYLSTLTLAALSLAKVHSHELYVITSPNSVIINQSVPLRATELADIVSSVMGFTVSRGSKTWSNLMIADPFSLAEAVVVLEIPGLKNPGFSVDIIDHHQLILDESLDGVYTTVENKMKQRLKEKKYSVMRGSLSNEEFLKAEVFHPKYKLNPSIGSHYTDSYDEKYKILYNEVFQLQQLSQGMKEKNMKNDVPAFHWFQLQGVKVLAAENDPDSIETLDNELVLLEAITTLVHSYNQVYKSQVLVIAITNDAKKSSRNKRETTVQDINDINVGDLPDEDYPIVFNLLLWFTVIFVFSLIAICLSIAQMDPGRDSIIYRMTSNRMKKEN